MAESKKKLPKMKKLTTAERNSLPASAFGDPAGRKYPIKVAQLPGFDKGQQERYATAAKQRAGQQQSMGNVGTEMEAKIKRKGEKVLSKRNGKKSGNPHNSSHKSSKSKQENADKAVFGYMRQGR